MTGRKSGGKGFSQRGPGLNRERSLLIENVKPIQFGQLGHSVQKRGYKVSFAWEEVGEKPFGQKGHSVQNRRVKKLF